jgi:hypothetical protein
MIIMKMKMKITTFLILGDNIFNFRIIALISNLWHIINNEKYNYNNINIFIL